MKKQLVLILLPIMLLGNYVKQSIMSFTIATSRIRDRCVNIDRFIYETKEVTHMESVAVDEDGIQKGSVYYNHIHLYVTFTYKA